MIELDISDGQLERAKELYSFGALKDSITEGGGNIAGALGEVLVYDYYTARGLSVTIEQHKDYDLIVEGRKVDVKTKRTSVVPRPDYLCSIAAYNIRQRCDFYYFVRVLEDYSKGYLLGYKDKGHYFANARLAREGEKDVNGWRFKADCYNLEISKLEPLRI
jgi:hypothetical protein